MIQAIVFDFDGTLADSLWIYVEAYKKALSRSGLDFTSEHIVNKCFGRTEEDICQSLNISDVSRFREEYFNGVKTLVEKIALFDGAEAFLQFAKEKGIKLGLATFAYRWYIDLALNHLALSKYFSSILSFNDVSSPKPHPEILLKSAEALGVRPEECLMIGDTQGDIAMGKAANSLTAIFISDSNKRYYDFDTLKHTNPDYEITSFANLKELISARSITAA